MTATSTRLQLRVAPGARRAAIVGRYGAGWKVRVTAPPERGRANDELVAFLAGTFALPRDSVRVVSGFAARDKVVEVDGLTATAAETILAAPRTEGGDRE